MNLTKLFTEQAKLDAHINENHPPQPGEDRLSKKILALLVELGECANEWRGFKFWSERQKPIPMSMVANASQHPLLMEYVDCLHFILSIGLDISADPYFQPLRRYRHGDVTKRFNDVFEDVAWLVHDRSLPNYYSLLGGFDALGSELGFTWEQIESAYMSKNATNHTRQENNY